MEKIAAFIGAGNMGGAVARAVCGACDPARVAVYDPDGTRAEALRAETGCAIAPSAATAARGAKYIVLCVKPQIFDGVLDALLEELGGDCAQSALVSIAASVPIARMEELAGRRGLELPVIRLLPNTPVSVGQGLTLMAGGRGAGEEHYDELAALLAPGGMVERVGEAVMDLACPVYSCSPAFACMFIEALSDGAVQIGLPRDRALRYAAQGVLGAAALLLESGLHPGQLKDAVCSPGGSTIAGVAVLERGGLRAAAAQAVVAAYARMKELEG